MMSTENITTMMQGDYKGGLLWIGQRTSDIAKSFNELATSGDYSQTQISYNSIEAAIFENGRARKAA